MTPQALVVVAAQEQHLQQVPPLLAQAVPVRVEQEAQEEDERLLVTAVLAVLQEQRSSRAPQAAVVPGLPFHSAGQR